MDLIKWTISYWTISYETISYGIMDMLDIIWDHFIWDHIIWNHIIWDPIKWTIWFIPYDSYKMVHILWTSLDHMVPTICYGKCLSFIFMDPNFEFFFLNFLWSILNQHNCQPNNFFAYFYIFFYLVVV